jgi:uncharacterized membrane protein (DUF4010 family)
MGTSHHQSAPRAVLRLREALMVAALLLGGSILVNWAQQGGVTSLLMGIGVAALADAHAPMASLLSLFGAGHLSHAHLILGIMVAMSANAITRSTVAVVSGGWRFGVGVASALGLNLVVGWAWVALTSGQSC